MSHRRTFIFMFVPLILYYVRGSPIQPAARIARIDRHSVDSHDTISYLFASSKNRASKAQMTALEPAESFKFNLSCSPSVSRESCSLAYASLQNAGQRIAAVLQITTQITVQAIFAPFCPPANKNCPRARELGGAVIGSFFAGQRDGDTQVYMYPQALMKQLHPNVTLEYSDVDIIAKFNSDYPYYFSNQSNQLMTTVLTDFEFVAVHELTHGLGFGSALLQYSKIYPAFAQQGYLAPNIFGDTDSNNISFLNPISLYDSYVQGSESIQKIGKQLSKFSQQPSTLPTLIAKLEQSVNYRAAQDAFKITTRGTNTLKFTSDSGPPIPLYAPKIYEQGSSISHLDPIMSTTKDFLMIPALAPGLTLENAMASKESDSVYGPGILNIMHSLGWPTKDDPTSSVVNVAINFGQNDYRVSNTGTSNILPILWLLLMFNF